MKPVIECAENNGNRPSPRTSVWYMPAPTGSRRGIEYDDLFQAGCMGLCKAADAFDETRGVRFSTYAVPVILGEMRLFRGRRRGQVSRTLKELSMRISRERSACERPRPGPDGG
ncbi:MAG: sigma factor [Anaerotruncus massiliensis (ex Togo et al. 2019)]